MIEERVIELTPKQEEFCRKYCETGNASLAYRHAYDATNMKAATINRKAAELMDNGKIRARVETIRDEAKKRSEVTLDQKRQWLVEIIERSLQHVDAIDNDGMFIGQYKFSANDAIRAINELNKMDGDHAATKREVNVSERYTLAELLAQAASDA